MNNLYLAKNGNNEYLSIDEKNNHSFHKDIIRATLFDNKLAESLMIQGYSVHIADTGLTQTPDTLYYLKTPDGIYVCKKECCPYYFSNDNDDAPYRVRSHDRQYLQSISRSIPGIPYAKIYA